MSIFIFALGALGYGYIELLFRGYTHWSMMLTGGACLLTLYYFNKSSKETPIVLKALIGALIITVFEFGVGLVVNTWFGWRIWDYSGMTGNVLGLICPKYTLFWFVLCVCLLFISSGLYYGFRRSRL